MIQDFLTDMEILYVEVWEKRPSQASLVIGLNLYRTHPLTHWGSGMTFLLGFSSVQICTGDTDRVQTVNDFNFWEMKQSFPSWKEEFMIRALTSRFTSSSVWDRGLKQSSFCLYTIDQTEEGWRMWGVLADQCFQVEKEGQISLMEIIRGISNRETQLHCLRW